MIKHSIVVVKPRNVIPMHQQSPAINRFNSQAEYDVWLKDLPFFEGQIITLSQIEVNFLGACAIVVSIERDYNKLSYTPYGAQRAKVMHVLQLQNDATYRSTPWARWDSVDGYRILSADEHRRLVEPNRDFIQDYCQQHLGCASPLIADAPCKA